LEIVCNTFGHKFEQGWLKTGDVHTVHSIRIKKMIWASKLKQDTMEKKASQFSFKKSPLKKLYKMHGKS